MRLLLLSIPLAFLGCTPGDPPPSETGEEPPSSDTGDTGDTVPLGPATLSGTVRVSLYSLDVLGDPVGVSWTDATGDVFIYGNIFVAAYSVDPVTGNNVFHDSVVIQGPSTAGDAYSLTVEHPESYPEIYVYAVLDYYDDGILGSGEPQATWPEVLAIAPLETRTGLDLDITTPLDDGSGGGGWGGGGCCGGGGDGGIPLAASGDATIPSGYDGERCFAMVYAHDNTGPYYYSSFYALSDADGSASSDWALTVAESFGASRFLGACDSNKNTLIEPSDRWGQVVSDGVSANPVVIAEAELEGLHLEIPFDGSVPPVTPFVLLDGTADSAVDFSLYGSSATLHVVALHTPLTGDIDVADFALAYDHVAFTGAELTGTVIPYSFVVPPGKTVYIWAFIDTDGDGLVNEIGEPLGSRGTYGRTVVGTTNQTGLTINVQPFADGG